MSKFIVKSDYEPAGDQPKAIEALSNSILAGNQYNTLLGVTGSGKTYTIAKVIEATQKPTLIMTHNKTLAAQLYSEFKQFFPNNHVEYFISYYDYFIIIQKLIKVLNKNTIKATSLMEPIHNSKPYAFICCTLC